MLAIETTALTKKYGALVVVDDVSLSVPKGQRRAIIGPNGAGKTTLFNLLSGDIPRTSGKIVIQGSDVARWSPAKRSRCGLRRTYQSSELFENMTVLENLAIAVLGPEGRTRNPLKLWASDPQAQSIARSSAEIVELERKMYVGAEDLSHGERRQLELGMALCGSPSILLLDEPAAGLSAAERRTLTRMLDNISPDITVLMIEHDMQIALGFAEEVTVLASGRLIASGAPEEIVQDSRVQEVYLGGVSVDD
ncbi:MAG: ATP-binding cassette domain-containing protein [Scrofimicrobium sp.]